MGARCEADGDVLVVRGGPAIQGIDADLRDTTELVPSLAVLAALADSPSRLRGIGHMRGHETDRLAALATELNRLGGDVVEGEDSLTIRPKPLHGGVFRTYDDHRLATSAAVLGLVVPGVLVENVATTGKTMPGFVELWSTLVQ
jgi:3-phosphoshikimate 1-carboxyvinyltransferase